MIQTLKKSLTVLICLVLILQLVSCGTILYPERRGQTSGQIDLTVALLDGVCLLFFLVPGVIAFAVDFVTGAIYLPGTQTSSLDVNNLKQIKFDPAKCTMADIQKIIEKEIGEDVNLDWDNLTVYELDSTDDMMAHFAKIMPKMKNTHVAFNMN